MHGTLVLVGGGEFTAVNEELDRRLVASGGAEVVVLPTADAFEQPQVLVDKAAEYFAGLGATARGLAVYTRAQALEPGAAAALADARFVYLAGDSQLHLRAVLKNTPLWDALLGVLERGGVVAAAGASAAALCDPMLDSRGGGVTLGLALVSPLTFVHRAETLSADWLKRISELAGAAPVAAASSGSALIRTDAGWEQVGPVVVRGTLPQ
jgi:cyanophycinase